MVGQLRRSVRFTASSSPGGSVTSRCLGDLLSRPGRRPSPPNPLPPSPLPGATRTYRFDGPFTLTLTAMPGDVPPALRLRRALKALRRAYGFRCIAIREHHDDT